MAMDVDGILVSSSVAAHVSHRTDRIRGLLFPMYISLRLYFPRVAATTRCVKLSRLMMLVILLECFNDSSCPLPRIPLKRLAQISS